MKTCFCIMLCFFTAVSCYAQAKIKKQLKSEHTLSPSYTPQWFPDKNNVWRKYYDYQLGQVFYPKPNQMGHNFGITYQFVHKTGVILSLGMQTGVQNHEVRMFHDFSFLGEQYKDLIRDDTFKGKAKYLTLRPMIGYRFRSPFKFASAWDIDVKLGIAMRWYPKTVYEQYTVKIAEFTSPDTLTISSVGNYGIGWGLKPPYGRARSYTGEYYVSFNRNVNWSFVRSLSVGIEGTFGLMNGSSGGINLGLYQLPGHDRNYTEYTYASKDFGLGIRFAIGLGYWRYM